MHVLLMSRKEKLQNALAYVRAHMPPPPAGPFGSAIPLLRVENNVGGTHFCIEFTKPVQHLIVLTRKHFNGDSGCLGMGDPDDASCRATSLVFSPGSVQIVGAPSHFVLKLLLHKLGDVLRASGYKPHMLFVSIDNRVATGLLGFPVKLETMHDSIPDFVTSYTPELFPGMICMHQRHAQQMVFTIFGGGKVTALGIQSLELAGELFLKLAMLAKMHIASIVVERQIGKSKRRAAQLLNETAAREADGGRLRGVRAISKEIVETIRDFLAKNAHRQDDPDFLARQKEALDALIANIKARADMKRRRIVSEEILASGVITNTR